MILIWLFCGPPLIAVGPMVTVLVKGVVVGSGVMPVWFRVIGVPSENLASARSLKV